MIRFACVVLTICAMASGFQVQPGSDDAARDKDVYAIYSLLMNHPPTSHGPAPNDRYLIAATTVPGTPQEPCVRPPSDREVEFRQVLADFERRKATPRHLKRAFSIAQPYVLLTDEEVKQFTNERMHGTEPQAVDERFRGATDLFLLTNVYFNEERTMALTAVHSWCGSLCGQMSWIPLEKLADGRWQVRPGWITCHTMSRNVVEGRPAELARLF
jgi:hypothetical protein